MAPYERSDTSRVLTMAHAADLEADMPGDCNVVLTLPAKPEYVALGRLAVAALAGWADLRADIVADLKVAVTEACGMLLSQGYGPAAGSGPPCLQVGFDLCADRWIVTVAAHGAPGAEAPIVADQPGPGGSETEDLGPAIIRAFVDAVEFGVEGRTSALRFTKTVR